MRVHSRGPVIRDSRTVLVVDDEASLRLLCRVNLELEGHRVLEAATVSEASALLSAEAVDVVLLDVHVGVESGLDVLDEIEALDLPVRVVLLSGTSEIDRPLRARVHDVLGKPFSLEQLADAVADGASGTLRGA
jgi:DNA-binding NtrC family response regulator